MKKLPAPRLALVQWDDIADIELESQWLTQEEAAAAASAPTSGAESIGWVLRKDRRWLVIAATHMEGCIGYEPIYSSIHKIPWGCVRSFQWLNRDAK